MVNLEYATTSKRTVANYVFDPVMVLERSFQLLSKIETSK